MSLYDWVANTNTRIRRDGLTGVVDSVYPIYRGSWRIIGSRLPIGTNVFESEWDVLVILDGCRVDVLEAMATDVPYVSSVESLVSVGSTSREWLAKTFTPTYRDQINRTAYVSANPFTSEIFGPDGGKTNSRFNPANWETVGSDAFLVLEEVWKDAWDDELGTVLPRAVTDRAISVGRTHRPDRMIVHYMQPHQPFLSTDAELLLPEFHGRYWEALRRREVEFDAVWDAYESTLQFVLDDVALLRENLAGDTTIITADHGNAVGEWGIVGHPNGCLHPSVKHVPWAKTTARDTGNYTPSDRRSEGTVTVDERLESLGYKP